MRPMPAPLGLYIHIPFCKSKCVYCDFYSLPRSESRMDDYTDALCAHLAETAPFAAGHLVDTVYFGGGTPSYLGTKRLVKILKTILKKYKVDKQAEITLEANPDSAGDWKELRTLRRCGFNRLSLGMQSADDEELSEIGRVHTMAQTEAAVEAARKAKFQNLSLDLIYGLPHQTLEGWQKNLSAALDLTPEHLSCYGLKVEEGTPLFARRGTAGLPGDDAQADMYLYTVEFLKAQGYEQYEISNLKAGLRLPAQSEILDPGGVRRLRPRRPLGLRRRAVRLHKGSGGLYPGRAGPRPHAVGERPHPTPGPGHRMGNAGPADHGGFGPQGI